MPNLGSRWWAVEHPSGQLFLVNGQPSAEWAAPHFEVMPVAEHEAALSRALAQNDGLYAAIQLVRGAILKAETRAEYLARALGRIAEEDVPLVEWAEDDLISEFARLALEAAPPGIESIDVEAALSPDGEA